MIKGSIFHVSVTFHPRKPHYWKQLASGIWKPISTNPIHGDTKSPFWMIYYFPLFTFVIHRASWESVQGRPKSREAPFLLCFNHIILQRYQFIKKHEFCCQVSCWFLLPNCGWWLHISDSSIQSLCCYIHWEHLSWAPQHQCHGQDNMRTCQSPVQHLVKNQEILTLESCLCSFSQTQPRWWVFSLSFYSLSYTPLTPIPALVLSYIISTDFPLNISPSLSSIFLSLSLSLSYSFSAYLLYLLLWSWHFSKNRSLGLWKI